MARCLVLSRWLCLQSAVAMILDFDTGLSHKAECTVELEGSFLAVRRREVLQAALASA